MPVLYGKSCKFLLLKTKNIIRGFVNLCLFVKLVIGVASGKFLFKKERRDCKVSFVWFWVLLFN